MNKSAGGPTAHKIGARTEREREFFSVNPEHRYILLVNIQVIL